MVMTMILFNQCRHLATARLVTFMGVAGIKLGSYALQTSSLLYGSVLVCTHLMLVEVVSLLLSASVRLCCANALCCSNAIQYNTQCAKVKYIYKQLYIYK